MERCLHCAERTHAWIPRVVKTLLRGIILEVVHHRHGQSPRFVLCNSPCVNLPIRSRMCQIRLESARPKQLKCMPDVFPAIWRGHRSNLQCAALQHQKQHIVSSKAKPSHPSRKANTTNILQRPPINSAIGCEALPQRVDQTRAHKVQLCIV